MTHIIYVNGFISDIMGCGKILLKLVFFVHDPMCGGWNDYTHSKE